MDALPRLLLFLHVLSAVVWVGGAIMVEILAARARKANDPAYMAGFTRDASWLGGAFFAPAAMLTLVFGILLVVTGPYKFEHLFVVIGLAILAVAVVLGMGVIAPTSKKLRRIAAEQGPQSPEFRAALRRIETVSRVELVLLVLAVADMTIKPGL